MRVYGTLLTLLDILSRVLGNVIMGYHDPGLRDIFDSSKLRPLAHGDNTISL